MSPIVAQTKHAVTNALANASKSGEGDSNIFKIPRKSYPNMVAASPAERWSEA